jgi:hypothetical protein
LGTQNVFPLEEPAMLRRAFVLTFIVALGISTAGAALLFFRDAAADPTTAAETFLASLDDAQRGKATMGFDDPRRLKWHFIPLAERKGLQIKEMNPEQRKAAMALLESCVSEAGYQKAETIMGLEAILKELEKTRKDGPIRDNERYYWTVFGTPSKDGKWGLSVEGHHMSLNYVIDGGKLSAFTPSMFGANPAMVHMHIEGGAAVGTRILKGEEDLAFKLVKSLDPAQQKQAITAEKAPADVRAAGEPQAPQTAPEGIAAKDLKPEQVETLRLLLSTYLNNMPRDTAAARVAEIEKEGFDKIHFSWQGALEPGIGHYYRVQGPTFLCEFVNVQPDAAGRPANHIHAVWRDVRGDFGVPVK